MAQRRMFSLKVIDTDLFMEMPQTTRLLYYDLCMRADDDGFVSSPKKIMKMVGCSEDDLKILLAKKYVIPFESGICVIRHWRVHNYIRVDRYTETDYKFEKSMLVEIDNKYEMENVIPNVIPDDNQVSHQRYPQVRDRVIDKDNNIYSRILDYLNEKTGSNYRATTKKTIDVIKARLNENFTYDDFIKVIDIKVAEWKGTEYEKYLRPETLFGNKFEGYLNQKTAQKDKPKSKYKNLLEEEV